MSAAAPPNVFAVYVSKEYENPHIRSHFASAGYVIIDETTVPDFTRLFTKDICKNKLNPEYIDDSVSRADFTFFIYESKVEDVLGFCTVSYNPRDKSIFIGTICASGKVKGIGTRLLSAVDDIAPVFGADHIYLEAINDKDLTEFYKKRGFKFLPAKKHGSYPMEKNLTGRRVYNNSLSFESVEARLRELERLEAEAEEKRKLGIFVPREHYGLYVMPLVEPDQIPSLSALKDVYVTFSEDVAEEFEKPVAPHNVFDIIMGTTFGLEREAEMKEKLKDLDWRANFLFYDFESDPTKVRSFAVVEKDKHEIIVKLIYLERPAKAPSRGLLEFLQMLQNIVRDTMPGSVLKFDASAIYGAESELEPPEHTFATSNSRYYLLKRGGRRSTRRIRQHRRRRTTRG